MLFIWGLRMLCSCIRGSWHDEFVRFSIGHQSKSEQEGSYIYKLCATISASHSKLMNRIQFFKNVSYYLSPFSLLIIFSFLGVLFDKPGETKRWAHSAASMFIPAFFILGALYAIIRIVLKERILWIWIVEIFILLLIYFFVFIYPEPFMK